MTKLTYQNAGRVRDNPLTRQLETVLKEAGAVAGLDEIVVISGGQPTAAEATETDRRTGSTRHDHGNAADIDLYKGGKILSFNRTSERPIFVTFIQECIRRGAKGVGAGAAYMGVSRIHVGYGTPAYWGAGGKTANAPAWLKEAWEAGMKLPPPVFVPLPRPRPEPPSADDPGVEPGDRRRSGDVPWFLLPIVGLAVFVVVKFPKAVWSVVKAIGRGIRWVAKKAAGPLWPGEWR